MSPAIMTRGMISAVVCTYNRARLLRQMLESFFAQPDLESQEYELIVVDNNSSDATPSVVEACGPRPGLRYVLEKRQGLSCARNRGTEEAHGDIVAFLDDDVIVGDHWLTALQACFEATHADAVGGRSHLTYEAHPPAWLGHHFRVCLSEVDLGPQRQTRSTAHRLHGLNLAFRKSTLQSVGGFDETLGRRGSGMLAGEEYAVLSRIIGAGGRIVYEPDATVWHVIERTRLTWDYFRRLSLGTGRSTAMLDPPAGPWTRTGRVVESLIGYGTATLRVGATSLRGRTSYEWRRERSRCLRMEGLLVERWRRLISPHSEPA
jgi:GT2 family glycosyltransferase